MVVVVVVVVSCFKQDGKTVNRTIKVISKDITLGLINYRKN